MSDYGADPNPNMPQMADIARVMNFIGDTPCKADQWSLDSAARVCGFHDGTNLVDLHIKFDPRQVPPD